MVLSQRPGESGNNDDVLILELAELIDHRRCVISLEIRELECFLVLAEELHFGRTADRLYLSQGRVSQLLRSLEHRVGGQLVERTSRRVALTPLGKDFLDDLRPAYAALERVVERTREAAGGTVGRLRIGFQGTANDTILGAVTAFQERHPACTIEVTELPLNDPFSALRRGAVDAAVVMLPVAEDDLVLGPVFSEQPQTLTVSIRHPLANRASLDLEDLAGSTLISVAPPAPVYWRHAQAPPYTPSGALICRGPEIRTLQEGLSMIAADRGGMLLCRPTAEQNRRADLVHIPLTGVPPSALGLVWRRGEDTPSLRTFAAALAGR
ncbi:DNA-binding transcriptional LysR family regulator [Kribbella amoyensis]|uniref:DNA-binding transcriptional LysR family regulator n=2 Tax=Kribbella amoyensis TaxID=996641 RepID=A0A561BK53_9ACTN|nr:DNA-binding transcriptional LysR family regulator [Kribbella amoyensis]